MSTGWCHSSAPLENIKPLSKQNRDFLAGLPFGALRFHLPSDPAVGSVLLRTLRVPHYDTILRSHPLTEGWERSATASSPRTALTRLASDCPLNSLKCSTRQALYKQLQAGCCENTEQQHLNLETSNTHQTTILLQRNRGSDSVLMETWNER